MFKQLTLAAALLAASAAQAQIVAQWNFNSTTPDANTATGVTTPSIGAGTASLQGGTTATFASGDASGGSSDPAVGDDSGWNVTTFPTAAVGDKTAGAAFFVSTLGLSNVGISYDLRHSNTSSRWEQVQYTTNSGSSWVDVALFQLIVGDTWANNRSVDLTAIPAVNNNANFGFRVVSTFGTGNSAYQATSPTGTYGTTGTWRFDMATVTAVPEPGTYALLLAGLGIVGFVARRRQV